MSEFTDHIEERISRLESLFNKILKGENLPVVVSENQDVIKAATPADIIFLVDRLVALKIPMDELKKGINKLLNLLYKTISEYPYFPPPGDTYLGVLIKNNRILDEKLKQLKPLILKINSEPENSELINEIWGKLNEIEKFTKYYQIKENVLFPVIERHIAEHRCLSVMWSFHDDIRRNLKLVLALFLEEKFDLVKFNRLTGELFFTISAVKFREERILFPFIRKLIVEKEIDKLFVESEDPGFPFYQPKSKRKVAIGSNKGSGIDLETGNLTVEQIQLLFNHLPVDITYVDENDKVVYFSSPKKRLFPRTKSVIGRDVHNCHPPESVHVVEKIIKTFRSGEKDIASFWIDMKGEKILIQYFAIRNQSGTYKGVMEVAQEVTFIQKLQGEKRILDWEK